MHIKVIKLICDSSAAVTFTLYHLQGFQIGCVLTSALSHHHSVSLCLLHKHECQSIQLTKQLTAHWSHVLFSEDFKGTHRIFFLAACSVPESSTLFLLLTVCSLTPIFTLFTLWTQKSHCLNVLLRPGSNSSAQPHFQFCSKRFPCSPKSIFPSDHHYKRDVRKIVDKTSWTANRVNYDVFYYECLTHGGFIFV